MPQPLRWNTQSPHEIALSHPLRARRVHGLEKGPRQAVLRPDRGLGAGGGGASAGGGAAARGGGPAPPPPPRGRDAGAPPRPQPAIGGGRQEAQALHRPPFVPLDRGDDLQPPPLVFFNAVRHHPPEPVDSGRPPEAQHLLDTVLRQHLATILLRLSLLQQPLHLPQYRVVVVLVHARRPHVPLTSEGRQAHQARLLPRLLPPRPPGARRRPRPPRRRQLLLLALLLVLLVLLVVGVVRALVRAHQVAGLELLHQAAGVAPVELDLFLGQ